MTDPAAIVAEVDGRARRVETPCGDGTMMWRIWGDGAPVVLSHGTQGSWSHWIRNIDTLAQRYMVIAADLPGHGDSAEPEANDYVSITKALADGLEQILGAGGRADFVGFSFGGIVFAYLARARPEFFRRLVLIGCGGLDTPLGQVNVRPVRGLEGDERRAALKSNLLGLMLSHPETVDDLALYTLVENGRKSRFPMDASFVMPDKLVKILPEIRVPVDAIWGEIDRPHPDPALQEEVIRRSHPDCDFRVIPESGHWAMYERTEAFNAVLLDMLARPVRGGAG